MTGINKRSNQPVGDQRRIKGTAEVGTSSSYDSASNTATIRRRRQTAPTSGIRAARGTAQNVSRMVTNRRFVRN